MATVVIAQKAAAIPYAPIALVAALNNPAVAKVEYKNVASLAEHGNATVALVANGTTLTSVSAILRYIVRSHKNTLYGASAASTSLIDEFIDRSQDIINSTDFKSLDVILQQLNHHLTLRSFFVGYKVSVADIALWGALKANAIFSRQLKTGKDLGVYLGRWFNHISAQAFVAVGLAELAKAAESTKTAKTADQGSFDINLVDAEMGKVVTRFPPEPSGYLHIGHAKAALLNKYFADQYKGRLIVRFDDTNPSKEKEEYEHSIKEDLLLIGIDTSVVSYTSDYFDQIYQYALTLIKEGKAYCDTTGQEQMRAERMDGIASQCRDLSVEENLRRFEEMKNATEFGLTCCLRAKISVDNLNKALRDPVIYRCNLLPHARTGNKWKMYPLYDLACPVVDSLEGVTHALRTDEYHDRNPQYQWFLDNLGLRQVHIWEYSRLSFVYTLMSKRKLTWFVDQGRVSGWDDPRFPTIRGILRRGLTMEALKTYILMQGASTNYITLEWDKLWAVNRKQIDPIAPRHTAVEGLNKVKVTVSGADAYNLKEVPRHKKNEALGNKRTAYGPTLWMDQADCKELEVNEEVTFMDWGNAFIRKIEKNAEGIVTGVEAELHLEGDFKKTKKKLTWLADGPELVQVDLMDYDYLITKKKIEEEDELKDLLTPVSEFKTQAVADGNVAELNKGDIIQFERKGYYIVDAVATGSAPARLILIPDGKVASIASKAAPVTMTEQKDAKDAKKKKEKGAPAAAAAAPAVSGKKAKAAAHAAASKPAPSWTGPGPKPEEIVELEAKIDAQGLKVRQLKTDKADADQVKEAVDELLSLKKQLPIRIEALQSLAAAASAAADSFSL
ncbi:glutamyl-tRNA synthetase [Entomortierella parvispora]|uniref:Probable glutamate--tRNA ligase, cytoplasmic n=1 Tax=Entomortierella parvispora TaxID=205924 RepID=A0A9P3HIZ1_9FUNG|nr:glutamyl-tRNA synthetase [Entomortierella parvispora]